VKNILVFDFDGTLADSKKLYIDIIYLFLLKHNYKLSKEKVSKGLGPRLDITLGNLGVSKKDVGILTKEINSAITKKALSLKLGPYVRETLKELSKNNTIILMTNSAKPFILRILKKHALLKYFSELLCAKFRKKEEGFYYIFKKYKTISKNVIYIADKVEDVKIAKRVKCQIIIVFARSWDKKLFKKEKYIIKNLKELLSKQF